jgi:hypothetical protein
MMAGVPMKGRQSALLPGEDYFGHRAYQCPTGYKFQGEQGHLQDPSSNRDRVMAGTKPPMKGSQSDPLAEETPIYTTISIGDGNGVQSTVPAKLLLKGLTMTLTVQDLKACTMYKDMVGGKVSMLNLFVTYNEKAEKEIGKVEQHSTVGQRMSTVSSRAHAGRRKMFDRWDMDARAIPRESRWSFIDSERSADSKLPDIVSKSTEKTLSRGPELGPTKCTKYAANGASFSSRYARFSSKVNATTLQATTRYTKSKMPISDPTFENNLDGRTTHERFEKPSSTLRTTTINKLSADDQSAMTCPTVESPTLEEKVEKRCPTLKPTTGPTKNESVVGPTKNFYAKNNFCEQARPTTNDLSEGPTKVSFCEQAGPTNGKAKSCSTNKNFLPYHNDARLFQKICAKLLANNKSLPIGRASRKLEQGGQ